MSFVMLRKLRKRQTLLLHENYDQNVENFIEISLSKKICKYLTKKKNLNYHKAK